MDGGVVQIGPEAVDALRPLIEHRGHVVTKEALMDYTRALAETRPIRACLTSLRALLEGDREASLTATSGLRRVIDGGFWCYDAFARDPWLDAVRGRPGRGHGKRNAV